MTIEVAYAESVDIEAPIDKVFAYRLDFMNLPSYMVQCSNIRRVDDGNDHGPGADYRFDLIVPDMGHFDSYIKVRAVDRPHRIEFDTGSEGFPGHEVSTFTELDDGRTRLELSFRLELPDEAKDGVPLIEESGRSAFRNELAGLKKLLEGN